MPKVETSKLTQNGDNSLLKNVSSKFGTNLDIGISLPKHRVVKKLIRIRNLDLNTRKRVVIKKRHRTQPTKRTRKVIVTRKRLLPVSSLILKTTVLSSIQLNLKTSIKTILKTYTSVIRRVSGDEEIVISTTEVKPQTMTVTETQYRTVLSTLTLLDLEATKTLPFVPLILQDTKNISEFDARNFEEARYNLATRVMSNGVEVIVAGDKSTLPGEPDVKRILPSTIYKPVTLKPSTLSEHMMMLLPQETSNALYPDQFVTKTCLTTFTYLTTYMENGTTTISSHEQVVSNIATEERNSIKMLPTPSTGITLTEHPNLAVGTFQTTYTYLNTILDGEQPLVVTSKHTVTNTVTAPDDYLSMLQPPKAALAVKDTNTYYSTISLQKTLYEGDQSKVVSTNEILTQVVITESIPPKATSVMTSYIALDVEVNDHNSLSDYTTTDVVETVYVTYTYFNTLLKNGNTVINTNISTSTDVLTQKLFLHPKHSDSVINTLPIADNLQIEATKTYVTTFTSFTTLLQEKNHVTSTIVRSHTREVENVVTEIIDKNLVPPTLLSSLQSELGANLNSVTKQATLHDGQKVDITAVRKQKISPTKVLPIEKTTMVQQIVTPSVVTGSTIIFFEDDDGINTKIKPTPALTSKIRKVSKTVTKPGLGSLLSSEIVTSISRTQTKRHTNKQTRVPSVVHHPNKKKTVPNKVSQSTSEIPDLLGLGSINTFQVLKPVINAMAGLIKTNISPKTNYINDSTPLPTTTSKNIPFRVPFESQNQIKNPNQNQVYQQAQNQNQNQNQNRAPIYIPIGEQEDGLEIAESQNVATIHINEWEENRNQVVVGKPTHESPLLNGGIPISPGQVITANSDVIVGKPGRSKPRIPSIPLSNEHQADIPLEMKPPPAPLKTWPKRHNDKTSNVINVKRPQPQRPVNFVRGEKYNHPIPLEAPKIQPSVVLPEVIERSTGQPLLVNLQPSQVAFVNIPHNRTTALIYGGSTEHHKHGQYFDDPLPYPDSEFASVDIINNGIPQYASIYQGLPQPNQKQVGGVIKVGANIPIRPSRPQNLNVNTAPISFGMMHYANDFNAHVINHGIPPNASLYFTSRPQTELIEYLTPPPLVKPYNTHHKRPIIPLNYNNQISQTKPPINTPIPIPLSSEEEDGANDSGEVVQESNTRPLRPGQIPDELLLMNITSRPNIHSMSFGIKVAGTENEVLPIVQKPRPFQNIYGFTNKNPQFLTTPRPNFGDINFGSIEIVPIEANIIQTRPYVTSMPVNVYKYAQNHSIQQPQSPPYLKVFNRTTRPVGINLNMEIMKPPPLLKPATTMQTSVPQQIPSLQQKLPKPKINIQSSLHKPQSHHLLQPQSSSHLKPESQPLPSQPIGQKPIISNQLFTDMYPPLMNNQPNLYKPVPNNHQQPIPKPLLDMQPPMLHIDRQPYLQKPQPNIILHKPLENVPNYHKPVTMPSKPLQKPSINTQFVPEPPTNMQPPKMDRPVNKSVYDQEAQSTHVTTEKPIYSLQINPPRNVNQPPKVQYTTTSTTTPTTRRRRPFTKRPVVRYTTTSATTKKLIRTRPTYNWDRQKNNTTTVKIENKPTMEVIIGTPSPKTSSTVNSTTSNILTTTPSDVYGTLNLNHNITNLHHHHAGNEVKIVDDMSSSTTTTTKAPTTTPQLTTKTTPSAVETRISPSAMKTTTPKEIKAIIPTRYITHTKTSTVTITKTTVVKTLGGPPSTMTILVTKTEKSTKVDTVTEFHTLVKPTSIYETITTTINHLPTSLYPSDVTYGTVYQSIEPTPTIISSIVTPTVTVEEPELDDLEEFIIHDADTPPPPQSNSNTSIHIPSDNDSIFVVMTDQKHGEVIPEEGIHETQSRDEIPANNEVNHVLLGGILIASPPSLDSPEYNGQNKDKCTPECKATKNELCQRVEGIMRCVCRPGFARMFPDRPCKPTYTYSIKLGLEKHGKEKLLFEDSLAESSSPEFNRLASIAHEALDRMVMQSDLRDIYHGVHVQSFQPMHTDKGLLNSFYLQLSDNTDDQRLKDIFKKYLRSNNYSLGGTDLYASKDFLNDLAAEDFDECSNPQFHDCSEHSHCFNLPGTYTCSCKEGFSDLSENILYPGRICSAELIGCEKCNFHGTCYSRGDDNVFCECFHWYTGENCHINLKVLLIALVTLGSLLFVLLFVCIILTCVRTKPRHPTLSAGMSFMPQRLTNPMGRHATLDRRAMIQDTSSEGSQSDINTIPYIAKKPKRVPKGALKKRLSIEDTGNQVQVFVEQKDRSLPVMIPRAKYHPAPPTSPHMNMESFAKRKLSAASSNEMKLLSYLDAGPFPNQVERKRKYSKCPSDSFQHEKPITRKISGGALVSAGFEVSATVGGIMGTLGTIGTTCGTEADRSENATLIQRISADLLSSTGTRSQFTTFRKSLGDNDSDDPLTNWLNLGPKITATVSEARSYDETTIQTPIKSFRNSYDSKPSSQHQNDEANTMAERDVGSTFLLPHTHLYKPDRGSDISGFDSL